jgi:hypothetical protein
LREAEWIWGGVTLGVGISFDKRARGDGSGQHDTCHVTPSNAMTQLSPLARAFRKAGIIIHVFYSNPVI